MKKTVCFILVAILLCGFAACKPIDENVVDIDVTGKTTAAPVSDVTEAPENTDAPDVTEAPATPEPVNETTPEPTETPELPAGQVLWLNTMPTDLAGLTEAEAEAWFADAVFVGDSIMLGWKNYNNSKLSSNENFFGPTHFLCEGSYGAGHALEPVSDKSLHPVYQGQQRLLWDSIEMMQAKKVFICFGLNDVAIYGVEGTANNFNTLCDKILDKSPDAKIYIISSMYLLDDSHQKKLTNENLRILNGLLRDMCDERGFKFVDIASHLVGPDGCLKAENCSEPTATTPVHQTNAAYKIWAEVLRSVAAYDIKWGN